MKIYFWIVGLILFIAFQLGWGIPFLINAKSTELFIAGVLDIVVSFPLIFFWVKKICKMSNDKFKAIPDEAKK